MKEYIFDQFVDNILSHTGLTREQLFEISRKIEYSNPRKFLYKLCMDRGITESDIVSYMGKNNYKCTGATIHQGIASLDKMMESDSDLEIIFDALSNVDPYKIPNSKPSNPDKLNDENEANVSDIDSLEDLDNGTNPIGNPTTIRIPEQWGEIKKSKLDTEQEQGEGGQVGSFNFPDDN